VRVRPELGQLRVERMTETLRKEVWSERFTFCCMRCDHTWSLVYEVRRYTGFGGQEWLEYCRDGLPVRVPHLDGMCIACGGLRVKVLPKRSGPSDVTEEPEAMSEAPNDRSKAV